MSVWEIFFFGFVWGWCAGMLCAALVSSIRARKARNRSER